MIIRLFRNDDELSRKQTFRKKKCWTDVHAKKKYAYPNCKGPYFRSYIHCVALELCSISSFAGFEKRGVKVASLYFA